MPKMLEPGILYVSEEFRAAAHLCACGCGAKIRTPLSHTDWTLKEESEGPTLHPSVGNWQLPCKSHYYIKNGHIDWASKWTQVEIDLGREAEILKSKNYYNNIYRNKSVLYKIYQWIKSLFV
jgi:hypothetical protein